MAEVVDNDLEIGALNDHLPGEPAQAIMVTPGQANIDAKNNTLTILPKYAGKSTESLYEILNEFCKICGIQKRPAWGDTFRPEANTWLMRLPLNSIRTWADFRSQSLDYFFPSTKIEMSL